MSVRALGPATLLIEGGPGVCFELAPGVEGFAVRFAGQVHAWINRCPHRGTRLDWEPGEFFDDSRSLLVCASHGALFQPDSGLCVGGPCRGAALTRIAIRELDGELQILRGV